MKKRITHLILLLLLAMSPVTYGQTLENFQMFWLFTNADGTNERNIDDGCDCGTVYIKNKSTYDNPGGASIGSALTTGTYTINLWDGTLGPQIASIPAANWVANQVIPVTVPCNSVVNFSNPGWVLNFRITHSGPGVTPYYSGSRHHTNGLNMHAKPTVIAEPDTTICAYHLVTLTATGTPGTNYLWTPGGYTSDVVNIFPSTSTTFTLTGTKTYTGLNPTGSWTQVNPTCTAVDYATITVNNGPSLHLEDYYLCSSDAMPVLDAGSSPVAYDWSYFDGSTTISAGTTQFCNTALFGYGYYTVTVYGANGCSTTGGFTVELLPSAGDNIDPTFNLFTNVTGSTMTLDVSSTEPGNHWWGIFHSDTACTNSLYPFQPPVTTSSASFGPLPTGNYYKIIHYLEQSPCNESAFAYSCSYETGIFGVNIHPNPTSGLFGIEIIDYDIQKRYSVSIYDRHGVLKDQFTMQSSRMNWDISNYRNGLNTVVVTDGTNTVTERLIKIR